MPTFWKILNLSQTILRSKIKSNLKFQSIQKTKYDIRISEIQLKQHLEDILKAFNCINEQKRKKKEMN